MRILRQSSLILLALVLPAVAQIPARNVNMVSGIKWPEGDPFLQRQNEPTIAVSSRNPLHILSGANDYRTVDLPGLPAGETADAWLGVFKSYDGGQTWKSTVHPGCPQKVAACDGAPLLKNFAAGADPVVRAGTNGMFYYSGLAFTRETPMKSVVFVSRFIDNNNEDNGDPIKFLSTVPVYVPGQGLFADKPWIAVDIPRAGAGTCRVPVPGGGTQSFPAGNLYIAFTKFINETRPPSQILFARSRDCGASWSAPIAIADNALNQGTSIAVDPATGAVYVSWRRFKSGNISDAILIVKSTDGGQTFSEPLEVANITPFDQGTSLFSMRTNAYPAMAIDGTGRVYLAWAERGFGPSNDSRIVLTTSRDGQNWTRRFPVSDFPARGHQFMPAMAFGGGKLMIVFYDLRQDTTTGAFTGIGQGQYVEKRVPTGDLATDPPHPEKVFTNFLLDAAPSDLNQGGLMRRHTIDVWSVQADAADVPFFNSTRVSQYVFGSRQGSTLIEQLQVNPPNLPLFKQGTAPFMGDYIDVTPSPWLIPGDRPGSWKFNTEPSRSVAFHAAWTDNRDVRPPINGDWTDYTPPFSKASSGLSLFDPGVPQPVCKPGQAGMRNQNIYTARLTQGLLVTSPANSKTLGAIQRAFPVVVTNSTQLTKIYRLSIVNQPSGGRASFLQFPVAGQPDPFTVLDVAVAPISSISRMVFVKSVDALASVRVSVAEISVVGANELLMGGLQGSVVLNPDPFNPVDSNLLKVESFNPDIANPDIANPDIANPDIANPDIANPDIANPDIANPDIANPDIANPDIANPDIANPDIANPDIANPDIANPDIANPDIANAAIADATWKVTNKGNSTATYSIKLLTKSAIPTRIKTQLLVHKTYTTPVVTGCRLAEEFERVVVANIPSPAIGVQSGPAPAGTGNITGDAIDNPTVTIGPGETVNVTLRFFNPDKNQPMGFDPGDAITLVTVSHAANTGTTNPPVASSHLILATGSLPAGVAGASYEATLSAAGGVQPFSWTIVSGALPPGLSLGASGSITGVISAQAGGPYNFTVQVGDSSVPAQTPIQQALSINVSRVALAITGLAAIGPSGATVKPGDNITLSITVSNSGGPANQVAPIVNVSSTGTASASCGTPNPPSAAIGAGGVQTYSVTCGSIAGSGTVSFSVELTAVDQASGFGLSVSPATSNPLTVLGGPPVVTASATSGGAPYAGGIWTNRDVVVTFTCTPSNGAPSDRSVTVVSEGASQTVTTTCTDLAGNSTPGSFSGIQIDKTAPQITARATLNGGTYYGQITNQSVVVSFTCVDFGGSGIAVQPNSQTFSSEGMGQTATGSCTDRAGNQATADYAPVNIVRAAPQIAAVYTTAGGAYTPGSWASQPVTITFTCVTSQNIPYTFLSGPAIVSTQGANHFVPGRCTDFAGNTSQILAGPVNLALSPPTLTLIGRPQPNAAGWFNSDVTFIWRCSDSAANTTTTVSRTISSEGAAQSVTATCTNIAGVPVSDTQSASLDKTPPVLSGLASPAVPASGWYTSNVSVAFTCTDALSGVAPGNPVGNTTLTADTNGTPVNGSCRDAAGNVVGATVGPIRIDRVAPLIQFQSVSPVNGAGWSNTVPVTVTWSCADSGSGATNSTVTRTLTTDGKNQSSTASCTDVAGNSASNVKTGINIDRAQPLVQFISPIDNFTYAQNATVFANYSCGDALSGVASCTAPVQSGQQINTANKGTFPFTVTATDVAGNQRAVTHTYKVQ